MVHEEATYQYCPEKNNVGMFFYTDCCKNRMYSIRNDPMTYHGCICPKCYYNGKRTVLYLRGTDEANRVMERRKNMEDSNAKVN